MTEFLNGCVGLFNDTLSAVWSVPVLRFYLCAALLALAVALWYFLVDSTKGK